jgi:DNA segregation ATPase FtsK/SpoIIIE-like protein
MSDNTYPMLKSDLEQLKIHAEFKDNSFGITRIQRYLKIGYNRACQLVDAAIEQGVLVRDSDKEYLVKLK